MKFFKSMGKIMFISSLYFQKFFPLALLAIFLSQYPKVASSSRFMSYILGNLTANLLKLYFSFILYISSFLNLQRMYDGLSKSVSPKSPFTFSFLYLWAMFF